MNHTRKSVLGLLCLAATVLVSVSYVAHALPLGTSTAPTSNTDDDGPCTGNNAGTQTGNCETEVDQANGPNDDVAAGDTDVDTAEN